MPTITRSTQTNAQGYQEVSLDYRIARSAALEATPRNTTQKRITCPMIDACRNSRAYGEMALPTTNHGDLVRWLSVMGVNRLNIRFIAYISGYIFKIPLNCIMGFFNDREINTGFLRSLKNDVNSGILAKGEFSQEALNKFVWSFRPDLQDKDINQEWLYSKAADALYLDATQIPDVVAYNRSNANSSKLKTSMGAQMSNFEMTELLVGVLAQEVVLDKNKPDEKVKAILVRDIYDLYRFGWIPAVVEEQMSEAGLLTLDKAYSAPLANSEAIPPQAVQNAAK